MIRYRLHIFGRNTTEMIVCPQHMISGSMWCWFVPLLVITCIACCSFPLCNYYACCGGILGDHVNIMLFFKTYTYPFQHVLMILVWINYYYGYQMVIFPISIIFSPFVSWDSNVRKNFPSPPYICPVICLYQFGLMDSDFTQWVIILYYLYLF